jgi:cyclopropane fatty-acyl-phospholipid synthase-like methyltransferase
VSWWLDELGHAGEEHLDPAYIAGYDRKSGFDPAPDLALLRDLGLDASSTLVDLGAGTGALAIAAAPMCWRVVAVDVSTAMGDALRARAAADGLTKLEVVRAGFLSYVHTGEPADFVYSRNALHHLPDFWKAIALRRVAAMMRIGGVLRLHDLVFSGEPQEVDSIMDAWLSTAAPRPEAGYTRAELETHVREEHSTYDWLLQPMLERAGFEIREATHRPSRTYSAYVCVRIA